MTALSSSVHLHARPETKEQLLRFFTDVLDVNVAEAAKAHIRSPEPMYAVTFSNGATLSVEFAQDALSDQQAQRGAWFYIQAPGGQVLRIVSDTTRER